MDINIWKLIARKVLLSIDIAVVATMLMLVGTHPLKDTHWAWAVTATIGSFIAAQSLQNKKAGRTTPVAITPLWMRIKNLFSLDFIAAFLLVNLTHYLCYRGLISSDIWFMIIPATASFYNIGNALSK